MGRKNTYFVFMVLGFILYYAGAGDRPRSVALPHSSSASS